MSREMAKGICQHLMDSHLIENASNLTSPVFKEGGVYMITPKGLHILERFITKNGISADHTLRLFAQQPICMKLLHLERRSADDEIIITKAVVEVLWRRFVGRKPNETTLCDDDVEALARSRWYAKTAVLPDDDIDLAAGIVFRKRSVLEKRFTPSSTVIEEYLFPAMWAVEWLLDYSTSVGPDEAAELAAQFVRYGFIILHSDTGKVKDTDYVATVRAGGAGGGAGAVMVSPRSHGTLFLIPCLARSRVQSNGKSGLQDHQGRDVGGSMGHSRLGGNQEWQWGLECRSIKVRHPFRQQVGKDVPHGLPDDGGFDKGRSKTVHC